jgi:hypothetical protein|tara:strand:- start:414 stop:809 length:396 start_codon:yes stop_codon:yes gene_type:complete
MSSLFFFFSPFLLLSSLFSFFATDGRVRVSYQFLEEGRICTEDIRVNRQMDYDDAKTFDLTKVNASDALNDFLSSKRAEVEYRVELMRRNGEVDRVLGVGVIDLHRILEDGSDRDFTPYKDLDIVSEGSSR